MTNLQQALSIFLLLMNALGLLFMYLDKRYAKKHARRIPEATLLWVAALGGSVGSWVGMYGFRHKTKHLKFTVGIPVILALQLALAGVLWWYGR